MTQLAVTGYASLDFAFSLAGRIEGDRTTLISHRNPSAWPRIGGCPAYVAMAVAAQGGEAAPVSWVGDDQGGNAYISGLDAAGADTAGVARLTGRATPTAILAYQSDGSCACLFDPVFSGDETLTDGQREVIAAATHLCVSVGPPQLMQAILECRSQVARLYWILKNDTHCFTPTICQALSGSADVIFCSAPERHLAGDISGDAILIETRGAGELRIEQSGSSHVLPVDKINIQDTTGAGDSLAGGYIAAEMSGVTDPCMAAGLGIKSARGLLRQRAKGGSR